MDEIEYEYSFTMTRQEILTEQLLTDKKNQFLEVLRAAGIDLDAEDVAQEAMIALWELGENGYPIRNPEALLVRIVKVTCIARLRKHRMDIVPIEGDNYKGGESATDAVEKMDEATIKKRLYECLSKTEREYMTLLTENGMTLDEISSVTGAQKPRISTALSKARKKLEEQFKKMGYDR